MDDVLVVLDHYLVDGRFDQVESLGSAGGMSGAQFWRVHTQQAALCLRRWPAEHPFPERLAFIHAVLRHAASRGIDFLPVPIRTRGSESFVQHGGRLWELTRWLPGKADYERSPSGAKLQAAMTALARFHIATSDFREIQVDGLAGLRSNVIQNRYRRLQTMARSGEGELLQAIDAAIWPNLAPLARQFLAALHSALPRVTGMLRPLQALSLPLQPCIRDIWHDHILFTGDVVTGFVDFGAVDIDTPACDIARLLGSLVGDDPDGWQKGLSAYGVLRPLTVEEAAAVRGLDASGTLLAGCNWIRWIYIEGREFENREQVTDRLRRILTRTLKVAAAK